MCCLFTTLVVLGPRFAGIIWWIINPVLWRSAFSSVIWPILGLLILPWTTLMYMLVFPGGIHGFEWVWIAIAVIADLASYGGGAYGNRNRIPGYSSSY